MEEPRSVDGDRFEISGFHIGTMYAVKQLFDLQQLDWKILDLEKSLAEVRARLADDSALTSANELLERLVAQLDDLTTRRRAVERTIAELQERLKIVESRLYGGAVTNPRELSAAEEERDFILRQQREEEDKLLEIMVEMEDVQSEQGQAIEALAKLEAETPAEKSDLLKQEERFASELTVLGQDRDRFVPTVPPKLRSLYESLRESKNGLAVAKVERGMCQGCRLALSTMELQRARGSQDVVQCSSCRRILHVV